MSVHNTEEFNPEKIPVFVIVIRGNETSESYYNYIEPSWTKYGFKLERLDATTPDKIDPRINFNKHNYSAKYVKRNVEKLITETEKATLISHARLWKRVVEKNENCLIMEHDAYLGDYDLFRKEWLECQHHIKLFGLGASCYRISPKVANQLCRFIVKNKDIHAGVMSYIADPYSRWHKYSFDRSFEKLGETGLPVKHIYDKNLGNTIDHYGNLPTQELIDFYTIGDRKSNEKKWMFINAKSDNKST